MSSASFIITAEEMSSLFTTNNCINAVLTFLVYDWLLCLDQEIALIWNWKSRRTVAPLVYVLARYMPIVENAFAVATEYSMSLLSCQVVAWVAAMSVPLGQFAPAVFSAMRTYALSGANVYLTVVAFILSMVPLITDLVVNFKVQIRVQVLPRPFNCSPIHSVPQQLEYKLSMINRACAISADLLVIIVTWFYTYKSYKIQKGLKFGSSLGSIMLYNGSIYFVLLASLNVLDMVLAELQIDSPFNTGGYVTMFLDPISYILICHFLLNLRQVDHSIVDPSLSSTQNGDESIQFARQSKADRLPAFVGPFGEPVHTGSSINSDIELEGGEPDVVQNASSEPDGEVVEVGRV